MQRALVTGAGGFIGSHLVRYLKQRGYWVRGVDLKFPEFEPTTADDFMLLDLRHWQDADKALTGGFNEVFALAADMGGMGFIGFHAADILHNNALININTIEAARRARVQRYFYSSSACVYPEYSQMETDVAGLKEKDAYPAMPDTEYGWEKLFAERLCLAFAREYLMTVRIARFHNIYGPLGTWKGGREKAPAALCRKMALAKQIDDPVIEIWGDGKQTRSFCYIDDCLEGIYRLMQSDYGQPLNIGSDRMISIDDLARIIARTAQTPVILKHITGPQGVRGRNSDNTLSREVLNWEPSISLEDGLAQTYAWIEQQVIERVNA